MSSKLRRVFVLTTCRKGRYRRDGAESHLRRKGESMTYERPEVTDFGSIADHTFTTPGGRPKGCQAGCHLDSFTENSALPAPS
jgi:hypothetical protein